MEGFEPHSHQPTLEDGLAFVNTLEYDRMPQEHLGSISVALRWFHEHGLMHTDALHAQERHLTSDPVAGERALARIRRVRASIRELVDAAVERRAPVRSHLDVVNQALRTPYIYQLVPAPDGVSLDHRHDGDPISGALARLAETVARDVSQGDPDRLRVCANDACRWVFHDSSRSGRRKWCDMATCGNRAKAARHRDRARRAASTATEHGDRAANP
jgi:predicted RNA-binding Zn ribbon-like protein